VAIAVAECYVPRRCAPARTKGKSSEVPTPGIAESIHFLSAFESASPPDQKRNADYPSKLGFVAMPADA
jgi:hypothetical protein